MIKKRNIKDEKNTLLQWIMKNILENEPFQRIVKFIIWSISMKWTSWKVLVVKVDEIYNIFKFASHCLLVERWRWNWMIKVQSFSGICPWMSIRLLCSPPLLPPRPPIIWGEASYCKRYSCRESLIMQYRWHWST